MDEYMQVVMTDESVKSLVRRCEEKEKAGWEFVTKIQKHFMVMDGYTKYRVVMRKLR